MSWQRSYRLFRRTKYREGGASRSNLLCQFACVNQPANKFHAAVLGKRLELLSLLVFPAKLSTPLHLPLLQSPSTQNFTFFFIIHLTPLLPSLHLSRFS